MAKVVKQPKIANFDAKILFNFMLKLALCAILGTNYFKKKLQTITHKIEQNLSKLNFGNCFKNQKYRNRSIKNQFRANFAGQKARWTRTTEGRQRPHSQTTNMPLMPQCASPIAIICLPLKKIKNKSSGTSPSNFPDERFNK